MVFEKRDWRDRQTYRHADTSHFTEAKYTPSTSPAITLIMTPTGILTSWHRDHREGSILFQRWSAMTEQHDNA